MQRFWAGIWLVVAASAAIGQGPRLIERDAYADRLRGMWLGQCIANWTGLRSEGKVTGPPFLTDADWGRDLGNGPMEFVLDLDPWPSDDDTDVEYVALHLLDALAVEELTGRQLAQGWMAHMDDDYLWVSNQQALDLMRRGVEPPRTSLPAANVFWLRIDAQLTTEFFGAFNPGMVGETVRMADVPIETTARGHAAHASVVFAVMHALASQADPGMTGSERGAWLVTESRRAIPDSSKAADIMDVVLADYLANPDKDDWERTRDLVYQRYQQFDETNGFRYRGWTESSVNFAAGLIALLYGEGDYLRTIQIGTLSGWDSDNGTATMGGLLGLMAGHAGLVEELRLAFPGYSPSDRYDIERTRDNLPDYLPDDPAAQDTLTLMAERMLPIIERRIVRAGGLIDADRGLWLLPPPDAGDWSALWPARERYERSANAQVALAGGSVTAWASVQSDPPQGYGLRFPARFANGLEVDDSGVDLRNDGQRVYYSSLGAGQQQGDTIELRVTYDRLVEVVMVELTEGEHFAGGEFVGGWFDARPAVQLRVGGVWVDPPGGFASLPTPDPAVPYEGLVWELAQPVTASGVRVVGSVGGSAGFVTVTELDCVAPAVAQDRPSFDLDANGRVGVDDIYRWHRVPVDLDGDGVAGPSDLRYLTAAVRWREIDDMGGGAP